ncbi:vacuolar protein sorting-associated protein 28 [Pisolithus orientalis]|uniref:vacuolar protein sorting-associated protein 28 n=1 Tax=Pisolithus orientalis TaxID=936130 RepID=UPI002224E0C1|nr:vacuolar protein sorting-associated protein 28 [Pisolithus orientalis]KAI5996921.1 vacuolar protein sorting-associated protein 28 [Pisolithus orientalis]
MLSLDEEVRLYTTNAEREKYSLLATLFGIVVALDFLERAYMTMLKLVKDSIPSIEEFMTRYRLDMPAALHRIKVGVPATNFIIFMDALKLRLCAKDQLHPILQELVMGYTRFKGSKEWEGRSHMVRWAQAAEEANEKLLQELENFAFYRQVEACRTSPPPKRLLH